MFGRLEREDEAAQEGKKPHAMSDDREKHEQMAQVQAFIEVGRERHESPAAGKKCTADGTYGKMVRRAARETEGRVQRTGIEAYRPLLGQVRGHAGKSSEQQRTGLPGSVCCAVLGFQPSNNGAVPTTAMRVGRWESLPFTRAVCGAFCSCVFLTGGLMKLSIHTSFRPRWILKRKLPKLSGSEVLEDTCTSPVYVSAEQRLSYFYDDVLFSARVQFALEPVSPP